MRRPEKIQFEYLRQEVRLVRLKTEKFIAIRDMDTNVETSIPYATRKEWRKLVKLFKSFNSKRYKKEQETLIWVRKAILDQEKTNAEEDDKDE